MLDLAPPLFVRAPAKINLTLDVLGKRADGYHELASVMQTIDLTDTVALWPAPEGEVTLDCDLPDLGGPDNLALRAALAIRAATGTTRGVHIELHKVIPMQGGLGGGSSDAATTLCALNAWWHLGLSDAQLLALAAELGSDVPFFIVGGTAHIAGRGELVTKLPDITPLWLVVAKPPVGVSTPAVFRALAPADYSPGTATAALEAHIRAGRLPNLNDATLHNALEDGVLRNYPAVATTRAALMVAGAPCVRMSGSGPTLYAPFTTLHAAAQVHQAAQAAGVQVWLTHTTAPRL
ncbi:MAG: 4-(cytidine 5'-diphospho)-2-C-methyl-D-erythritol kinase [Ktedonobacterales bacterium]|nr:4-(cytidine 5'-diphospho)-2-C-methyl-D-erythritol kinase [Ktedonobacterales bacterium]